MLINRLSRWSSMMLWVVALCATADAAGAAQASEFNHKAKRYLPIDSLLAPIALYPDPLLSTLMTALDYPRQLRDAQQWFEQHQGQLNQRELLEGGRDNGWHPSVTALTQFPYVLGQIGQQPLWVQHLRAFKQTDLPFLLARLQVLRGIALENGFLASNEFQQVIADPGQIYIQTHTEHTYFVPYYDAAEAFDGHFGNQPIIQWLAPYPAKRFKTLSYSPVRYTILPLTFTDIQWHSSELLVNADNAFFYRPAVSDLSAMPMRLLPAADYLGQGAVGSIELVPKRR